METLKNQQQKQSNTTILDSIAERYIPIKLSDCALIKKKKLHDREQLKKEIQAYRDQ